MYIPLKCPHIDSVLGALMKDTRLVSIQHYGSMHGKESSEYQVKS